MVKKEAKKVPEALQKLRSRIAANEAAKSEAKAQAEQYRAAATQEALERSEKHLKDYVASQVLNQDNQQTASESRDFWVEPEPKVILAIRIKGINRCPPKVRSILKLFRLIQLHSAVLIKNNKATKNMLKLVEPWITYGYPSRETIQKLVYKRGYLKINKSRIPLYDNAQIEKELGKFKIVCAEDVVTELATCGPHFKEVNSLLWRYKLSSPKGGFSHKRTSYIQGGDWGNREKKINNLVLRML
ncbi:unnamed protein product [Blepharisma stoltei]|uniref:Large ribosomal subunit protein uL30-like ferredoxin-like fold domain-containing protein n=1 Tax=Blepharisma stoltei TaxID=1481888 RepID=A0AAU9JYN6_9CILI|nr:unnamed protein product [Blepharisma stoltei]